MEDERKSCSPTRALLTGAAGFAGSHCLRHLLTKTDWNLICPVSFSHRGLPERLISAVGDQMEPREWWDRITIMKFDLSSPINDTTMKLIGHVDFIINYASESHVDRSITEPASFIRNNVDLALNLLEFARKVGPKAVLLISTDEVYGPAPDDYKHREWDSIIPSNPYSASKAAQEVIAVSYWRTYNVPIIIVNAMNLIGETQDPEKFVPKVISKVLRSEEVPIHASMEGRIGSRFYLHARNLADAVLFLLRRGNVRLYSTTEGVVGQRPDRWNVVGEREVDNLELAKLIAKLVGKPLKYKVVDFHSSRPGHDLRYALDGAKIQAAGWNIPIHFEDSLRQLIGWTLKHKLWSERVEIKELGAPRPNDNS